MLDAEIIRTENALRRPFQGWRYLDGDEAPRDLPKGRAMDDALPPELAQALAEIGLR
ncbi:MAG: lysophospholipase L1-like protein [uncultured bacterium]|nr:MAG: lysophospholipase L1-like protein [uncultured bacterium]